MVGGRDTEPRQQQMFPKLVSHPTPNPAISITLPPVTPLSTLETPTSTTHQCTLRVNLVPYPSSQPPPPHVTITRPHTSPAPPFAKCLQSALLGVVEEWRMGASEGEAGERGAHAEEEV